MEKKYKKLTANKVHEAFPTIGIYVDMEVEKQNLGIMYCRLHEAAKRRRLGQSNTSRELAVPSLFRAPPQRHPVGQSSP